MSTINVIKIERDTLIPIDPTAEYRFPFGNAFIKDGYLYLKNGNRFIFTCVRYFSPLGLQYIKTTKYIRSKTAKWKSGEHRAIYRAWQLPLPDGVYEVETPATNSHRKRYGNAYMLFYLEFIDGEMVWTTREKYLAVSRGVFS
jgi:hypothetical protein